MSPLQRVLRWGRSSYETDVDLRREREAVEGLGLSWELETARPSPRAAWRGSGARGDQRSARGRRYLGRSG